ncbi:MAG: hypothetical protein HY052_01450 [Proteobacteria bacterium]|nr:hypothetical protein [Pseudomonadota bacterium]
MRVIERFTASTKGDRTEDLIVETPDFYGVFDGVTGVKPDWLRDGRTMGQWASFLAGAALEEMHANATIQDFAKRATEKLVVIRKLFDLMPADRLASTAVILPRRRPLEVWSIGDSHYSYRLQNGAWNSHPQTKLYDEVTLAYRKIVVLQEILERGEPQITEERAALAQASWNSVSPAIGKQLLLANHPDPREALGFGLLTGTEIPQHHLHIYPLPDDAAEVVLCTDGFPEAVPTAVAGQNLLNIMKDSDPFLIGKNPIGFMGHKGGFVQMNGSVADYYDDVAYLRIAV